MPTINQVVNFRYGLKANLPAIRDLNTLYFSTDTLQLFVGDDEYTKVTEKLSAVPKSGTAGVGTPGEHGKLYYYNNSLYLCEVTGGTTPTYTWTIVANINTKNGTVTSVALKAGTGLSVDSESAITSSGTRTISHAIPTGSTSGTTSPSTVQTPTFGGTFNIPVITTDKFGHVTGKSNTTVKIPSQTSLSKGADTTGSATSLAFGDTFTVMTDTSVSNHTITDENSAFTLPDISAKVTGSGNVVTAVTAADGTVNITKGSTAVLTSGNQTIAGVKTFSSFPITPSSAPTTNYQTANKKYVDDKIADITKLAICDSASADNPKVVTIDNFQVVAGATINIRFTNSNTAQPNPLYLKVNDIMKPIYLGNVDYRLAKNTIYTFIYYNSSWYIAGQPVLSMINNSIISDIFSNSTNTYLPICKTGSWEPTCDKLSLSNSSGRYIRIGSYVHCWFKFIINQQTQISSGGIQFFGLPYKPSLVNMLGTSNYNSNLGLGTTCSDNNAFHDMAVLLDGDGFTIEANNSYLTGNNILNILSNNSVGINGQFSYYTKSAI